MSLLRIGEVAKRSEVSVETVRYYERQGLLAEPDRRPSGYRQYDESVVARIAFIKRSKGLGFTLREIKELLGLWFNGENQCDHVREKTREKLEDIEAKIRTLQGMKRSLRKVLSECTRRDSFDDCPLWGDLGEATN